MPTTLHFAHEASTTPGGEENPGGTPGEEQNPGTNTGGEGTNTETGDNKTPDAPNTGSETLLLSSQMGGGQAYDAISHIPIVLIVTGALIALVTFFVVINKKKTSSNSLKLATKSRGKMTKALYASSFVMVAAGLGGTLYFGNKVEATDVNKDVYAELYSKDDVSSIYCATDNLAVLTNGISGYMIRMNVEGGILASQNGQSNINSLDNWGQLTDNTWGFSTAYTREETASSEQNSLVPLPTRSGVIANKTEVAQDRTEDGKDYAPVRFCAKIPNTTPTGEYIATVNYEAIPYNYGVTTPSAAYIDYNSKEDPDGDGISNRRENQIGTNPVLKDTDFDGLDDNEELYIHGTDPFVEDTDGDTITDYSEVELGLDPNNQKTGGVTNDKDKTLEYEYYDENHDITVTLRGKGNLPKTYVRDNNPEVTVGDEQKTVNILSFATEGEMTEADIEIPYDDADLAGLNTNDLVFYHFDGNADNEEDVLKYEGDAAGHNKIEVDTASHTLKTTVTHFSDYTIGENGGGQTLIGGVTVSDFVSFIKDVFKVAGQVIRWLIGLFKQPTDPTPPVVDPGDVVDYDGDGIPDHVLADSGFQAGQNGNGLSFKNPIISNGAYSNMPTAAGSCYGMAKFTEEYFTGKLVLSNNVDMGYIKGYDLTKNNLSTFRANYNNKAPLYTAVKDKTSNYLVDVFGYSYIDYNRVLGDKDTTDSDLAAYTNSTLAIARIFMEQATDPTVMSDENYVSSSREPGREPLSGRKSFIDLLIENLGNSDPLTTSVDLTDGLNGGHAVNATKIIQDGSDETGSTFFLEVYDSNFKDRANYIVINCEDGYNCRAAKKDGKSYFTLGGTKVQNYQVDTEYSPYIGILKGGTSSLPTTRQ